MLHYEEARVELTNSQLNKLKSAAKNKTGATLRIAKKNFQDEELPHELILTTLQKQKQMILLTVCRLVLNFVRHNYLK